MPRATYGAARRQKKNRWFEKAKGNRGARRKQWRKVKQTVVRSGVYAYEGRKQTKRNYRSLWITRLNAACRSRGMMYSRFVFGLKLSGIGLNRKMLSEIAILDEAAFDAVFEQVKQAIEKHEKAAA
jgi:large subunit ribosomal protein L20